MSTISSPDSLDDLLRRLQVLERSKRRWKAVGVTALAVIALLGLGILIWELLGGWRQGEPRLLGTWKSNREKTLAEFRKGRPFNREQEDAFGKLFDKLRVTYTDTAYTTEFEGSVSTVPYEVVGKDAHTVVIRSRSALSGENELTQIHFEGPEDYWILLPGGGMREFFSRVK